MDKLVQDGKSVVVDVLEYIVRQMKREKDLYPLEEICVEIDELEES